VCRLPKSTLAVSVTQGRPACGLPRMRAIRHPSASRSGHLAAARRVVPRTPFEAFRARAPRGRAASNRCLGSARPVLLFHAPAYQLRAKLASVLGARRCLRSSKGREARSTRVRVTAVAAAMRRPCSTRGAVRRGDHDVRCCPAACGVHKSVSCREAVFVDQSAEAISTCDFARSGRAGE
jgi:hypothetical protein